MPRTAPIAPGGMVFHVLNRGVARMLLFEKPADYPAFEQVLQDALDQSPMRICACAVMPNHWHLLLWAQCDGELAMVMQRLTITHVRRWQEHRGYAGLGHVYQGRYKSFPVQSDEHMVRGTPYSSTECASRGSGPGRPGRSPTQAPGKEVTLPPPPPLRTARESFPSCSSSLHERPSQDAAAFVSRSCTWICR